VSGAANDVSNSHEPSYYEIALTNRQVIVAFVLLLLCLIAAFFSGVWIGRESGARLAAEQMVRNAPPPEEKKEGQNLEELQFFDQNKKGKGGKAAADTRQPEPAPAPAPPAAAQSTAQVTQATPPKTAAGTDPTLGNDLGEDTEAAPRGPKPTPAMPPPSPTPAKHQKPTPVPTPAKAGTPAPEKVAQAKPAAETPAASAPSAAKTPKKTAEAAAEPAHAAGQVVIQVFSSAEKDQAVRIRDRLVGGGQSAYLSPVEVAGRTMYRVRIGPFNSRDQAQKVAEQVRKGYKLDTWVTE